MKKPKRFEIFGKITSIDSLRKKVKELSKEQWNLFNERKVFPDQQDSLTIPLINLVDKDNLVFNISIRNDYILELLKDELAEIDSIVKTKLPGHEVKRSMLVLLPAGQDVLEHRDSGYHLEKCHRVHVPIITNKEVVFEVFKQVVPMEEGTVVEINNNILHSVTNKSIEDRVHLITDYGKVGDPYYFY